MPEHPPKELDMAVRREWLLLVGVVAVAIVVVLLLLGPGGNDGSSGKARNAHSISVSAEELAQELGCGPTRSRVVDPGEPARPVEALDCLVGEEGFGIQVYESDAQRDIVLEYLHQYAGVRVVGPRYIVGVDTPEAGRFAANALDAEFVTLRGTSGG
jgi:hypothetical protein